MSRGIAHLFLVLILGASLPAQPAPFTSALIDSLIAWRDTGRPDLVEDRAAPALATARAAGDTTNVMSLLLIRGATRAGVGQVRQAETDLREAAVLAVDQADTLRHLQCIRWLSVAVGLQGRGAEAAGLYDELETLARAADDSLHLGWAWVGQAYSHYLSGRTIQAAGHYALAAGVLERYGEAAGAMWAWNGRGMALRQAGRYDEAREAFHHVLTLAEARDDAANTATALDNLGRLDLQLGDPGQAEQRFARSAAIHRSHRHHREGLVPCIDLAQARTMQGRYAAAEALLDSVLTVTRELGLRDLEVLAAGLLADVRMSRRRPGAAAALCRDILAPGEMPSRLADTEIRLRLARALADRDSAAAAVAMLEEILAAGAGAVSLELRTAALLGSLLLDLDRADRAVAVLEPALATARNAGADVERVVLLTHLGRAAARQDRPDAALAAYREAITTWEEVRSRPADPAWRELRGTVAGSLFAQTAALLVADPARLDEAWSLVQRYRARTLQERMRGPGASGPDPAAIPDLADFRRRTLRPGEVWLEIVEGEGTAVMFCISRDSVRADLLPGWRRTRPRMRRLTDVVAATDITTAEAAEGLARSVLAEWPAAAQWKYLHAERILWCPDGTWHRFPAVLAGRQGPMSRVPAAAVLAGLRREGIAPSATARVLAVSGPDPEGTGPLPGAAAEVRWLAAHFRQVQVRTPSAANLDTVAWRRADVLHLAAHTELESRQPWNTSITLAAGDTGRLLAADIADLDLRARLVVLTGCTTVGSRLVGGEGLIGLTGAFLAAGAPTVLATLWPVDDAAALRMTRVFYDGLADGLSADLALDRGRRTCRADPAMAAPRHWAGFILVGDGEVAVPLHRRASRWPWVLLLAGLAVVIYLRGRS